MKNTQIANKIIQSTKLKNYTRYSLQACYVKTLELEGDFSIGKVVSANYTQTQVLLVEEEKELEIAANDPSKSAQPDDDKPAAQKGVYNPNVFWKCNQMGHFARECPNPDPQPTKALGNLHHTLEAETPVTLALLNEFFNKLIRVEKKNDITKANLKKAYQQVCNQTGPSAQPVAPPAQAVPAPRAPTPPPANVPRKAQVGQPPRQPKPKTAPAAALVQKTPPAAKLRQPKPRATRARAKNKPVPGGVTPVNPEEDEAAPPEDEYDTNHLANLPTDSEAGTDGDNSGGEGSALDEQ